MHRIRNRRWTLGAERFSASALDLGRWTLDEGNRCGEGPRGDLFGPAPSLGVVPTPFYPRSPIQRRLLGLKVTGVLGVLLRSKRDGRLICLRETMEQLQTQCGFRIGPALFADILQKGGEA